MTPDTAFLPGYVAEELAGIQRAAIDAGQGVENPAHAILESLNIGIARLLAKARRAERVRLARTFADAAKLGDRVDAEYQAQLDGAGAWNLIPGCLALAGKCLQGKDGDWTIEEMRRP